MATTGGVVVWEWQNEFGFWGPYSATITKFIEQNQGSPAPLSLGQADPSMYQYAIDLQNLLQIRQGTGTTRSIRKKIYPASYPIAKGITWQWMGDTGQWIDYDPEIAAFLETQQQTSQGSCVDLSISHFSLPYIIDLNKMTQTRIHTRRVRQIRRDFTSGLYPAVSASSAHGTAVVNGTKRKACNKNSVLKRSRPLVTSTVTPGVQSHSLMPSSGGTLPSVTMATSSGSIFPGTYPQSHGSLPSTNQGPLTRNRYNQTVAAMSQGSGPLPNPFTGSGGITSSLPQPSLPFFMPAQSASSAFPGHTAGLFNLQPSFSQGQFVSGASTPSGSVTYPSQQMAPSSSTSLAPGFMFGPSFPSHSGGPGPHHLNLLSGQRGSRIQPVISGVTNVLASTAAPGLFTSLQQQPSLFSQSGPSHSTQGPAASSSKHGRISNKAPKGSKGGAKTATAKSCDDILNHYVTVLNNPPKDEDCCICCEKMMEASGYGTGGPDDKVVIQLEKCSHTFHKLCLGAMYNSGSKDGSLQCPTCKTIYGEKQGNCPRGDMEYKVISSCLPGYEAYNTIQILYHIPPGTQGPEHPHPGRRYTTRGFPRVGYLPDNDKGRKVLQLLIVAWKRRLTFTIGQSTTTGEGDTVTWNEIHHKTELGTNFSGHGYPDPNYLDNVLLELAVHGITEADLPPS